MCQLGGFGIFPGAFELFVRCAKILFPRGGGGVCVYFLESVRNGSFRNVWVRGGPKPYFYRIGGRSWTLLGSSAICLRSLHRFAAHVSLCRGKF